MGALKLRKDVSKPGLLRGVRQVFDQVVDPVSGRQFSIGACLMSAPLAVFLEQPASLLPFDLSMRGETVKEANLRRLYGLARVPCDTTLRRRLDPISLVQYRRAFQQVLQRAQRGKVLRRMAGRGHYLVAVDGTGTFSSQRVHGPCCLRARHRTGSTKNDCERSAWTRRVPVLASRSIAA